jgi:hypothetical protein
MRSAAIVITLISTGCGSDNVLPPTAEQVLPINVEQRLPAIDRRCAMLPGEDSTIKSSKRGINYFPESFGKPTQVCEHAGYPECIPTIDPVENEWYPKHWDAADEPSLYERSTKTISADASTLRFTWLPTFDHPVIVRIERSGSNARLVAKKLSGHGGYEPGIIEQKIDRPLTSLELARLDLILSKTKILETRATNCDLGTDGSQWIVEGVDSKGYVFVNRFSPNTGPVRAFGDFALNLTGWDVRGRY